MFYLHINVAEPLATKLSGPGSTPVLMLRIIDIDDPSSTLSSVSFSNETVSSRVSKGTIFILVA